MKKWFVLLTVLINTVFLSYGKEDYRTKKLLQLEEVVFILNNQENYEASHALLSYAITRQNLKPEEHYYGLILMSYLHKRLFDYEKVHFYLDLAQQLIKDTPNTTFFEVHHKFQRCLAFFDTQNYTEADELMIEINSLVSDYLNPEDLSMFYMQQGYIRYLDGAYDEAEEKLLKSAKIMRKHAPPHLPIIHTKLMEVYAAKNQYNQVDAYMSKALENVQKSGIEKYRILVYQVRKNIAEREEDFDTYLEYDLLFDQSERRYNAKQHLLEIKEQEQVFAMQLKELKLREKETANRFLLILLIGLIVILLAVLIFWRKVLLLNRKLKRQHIELSKLNRLNKEVFSVISHDLKEPLLTVNAFLDKLKEHSSDFGKGLVGDLRQQVANTGTVLNDLLTWSARELKFTTAQNQDASTRDVIEKITHELKNVAKKKGISFDVRIETTSNWDLDSWVLTITLRNLISNALKFSYPDSTVKITYCEEELSVKDYGVGVSKEIIIEGFDTRKKPSYGTQGESGFGIGLYLCQMLLKRNGYAIEVKPNEQGGTVFCIVRLATSDLVQLETF